MTILLKMRTSVLIGSGNFPRNFLKIALLKNEFLRYI